MVSRAPRRRAVDPPEVVELRRLGQSHPELADAVELQLELLQLQRRIQARVPLPAVSITPQRIDQARTTGCALLQFSEIPVDWTDFRIALRETGALLHRHGTIDRDVYSRVEHLSRLESDSLRRLVAVWYENEPAADGTARSTVAELNEVLTLAMRPFLARSAEALRSSVDLGDWQPARCPLCRGEAEFAAITRTAERWLYCSRCTGAWRYDPVACPFCENTDRRLIRSFASRDGQYRLYACERCRRYLKAHDSRRSGRPILLAYDTVATLPLDAAALEHGYRA